MTGYFRRARSTIVDNASAGASGRVTSPPTSHVGGRLSRAANNDYREVLLV